MGLWEGLEDKDPEANSLASSFLSVSTVGFGTLGDMRQVPAPVEDEVKYTNTDNT